MSSSLSQLGKTVKRAALLTAAMPVFACTDFKALNFGNPAPIPKIEMIETVAIDPVADLVGDDAAAQTAEIEEATPAPTQIAQTEDVEQPEIFQATDMAMWDGRPKHGNIWVSVPDALQPERVVIRNEETGAEVRGAMFVRDETTDTKAPIRLSSAAAKALGIAPLEAARISITAIRRAPQTEDAPEIITRRDTSPLSGPISRPFAQELPIAPEVSFIDTYLEPSENADGYVEVAQAIDPDGADRVQQELAAAQIPAEIQEDYVDGRSIFRVFADARVDHEVLGGTLEAIRFAGGAQGSDDGTLIAELPNFEGAAAVEPMQPAWMSVGLFHSRNEAVSVIQRLARKGVPGEICAGIQGKRAVFRVFAGPASGDKDLASDLSDTDIEQAHQIENMSFCMGVAAAEASREPVKTTLVRATPETTVTPQIPELPEGSVRIRVGEATGGLKFRIPNPYSEPVQIPVSGITMTMPVNTPPELVARVRELLSTIDGVDAALEGDLTGEDIAYGP